MATPPDSTRSSRIHILENKTNASAYSMQPPTAPVTEEIQRNEWRSGDGLGIGSVMASSEMFNSRLIGRGGAWGWIRMLVGIE
jgi:hypothetical protein